jgi:hypothetical protein
MVEDDPLEKEGKGLSKLYNHIRERN